MNRAAILFIIATVWISGSGQEQSGRQIALSTGKLLQEPVPGEPQPVGTLPASVALGPDGRYLALLEQGYGTTGSGLRQGIAILDLKEDRLTQFPEDRFGVKAHQTLFLGLAFSGDGTHLYASVGSLTDPEGKQAGSTGNGIAVYGFREGTVTPERFLPIAPQKLAAGKRAARVSAKRLEPGFAIPYPAGLAVVSSAGGERLLVADDLSDDVLLLDAGSGKILRRFDLSTSRWVPASFPYAAVVTRDGKKAWCSLWNASAVAELDLPSGKVARWIRLQRPASALAPGSHPTALLLSPLEDRLYVALANRDEVAVVTTATGSVERYLSTRLPGQERGGASPTALAQSPEGWLFAANAAADDVAVFDITKFAAAGRKMPRKARRGRGGDVPAVGFIPSEWYPTALAVAGDELLVATAKGQGPGPNRGAIADVQLTEIGHHPYIPAMVEGSIARVKLAEASPHWKELTAAAMESNVMNGGAGRLGFRAEENPIRHVIYVIKENRTYDQLFGDLGAGDGDPSLVMYGEAITPNHHKLARQFGVLDNFYASGEVSGNGHVWSTAAITSDYDERSWPLVVSPRHERSYDFEGEVAEEVPLEQGIADVDDPGSGFLWTSMARRRVSYRDYGEFVADRWCVELENELPPEKGCPRETIREGELLPPELGEATGARSRWPWVIPMLGRAEATKVQLRGHTDARYPGFKVEYPDQLRADEFLREFAGYARSRATGHRGGMAQFALVRLPNDHTSGTRAGSPTPEAAVADNDLALGRIVEAVSHSPYWDDTAILVVEDDAQYGVDHVDAHRTVALVISKYSPAPGASGPFVDHHFYTTVNLVRTIEALLGLPPMNNNDTHAAVMAAMFSGEGTQPAYDADWRNRDNGLLYRMNGPETPGAAESAAMDFSRADAADAEALDRFLWREAKGEVPMPEARHR